jgi:hypothetical protein
MVANAGEISWELTVTQLGSDSFHQRRAASDRLLDAADGPDAADAIAAVQRGLRDRQLEIRLACQETMLAISQRQMDQQIQQLLNPRISADQIDIPLWQVCAETLGHDMAARRRFATLYQSYPSQLRLLLSDIDAAERYARAGVDPSRLQPDDTTAWTLLLLLEAACPADHAPHLIPRSCLLLSSSQLALRSNSQQDAEVTRRLVDRWLEVHEDRCPMRECLMIAMRFECHRRVAEICNRVLRDPVAPAATHALAMLCASAINTDNHEMLLRSRINDHRMAHQWHLITDRKTKIRTQVGDVALALLLYRHGVDPRSVGYDDLQADPLMIYRDHSLGFPDDQSRQRARQRALKKLALE